MKGSIRTRLFIPQTGEERLFLNNPEVLEVSRVLRLRPGEDVALFSNDPFEYIYTVDEVKRDRVDLRFKSKETNRANPRLPCVLVQACGKAGKNADIVRQATALGTTQIAFFRADRSIGRISPNKGERLRTIAIESCRQCGRSRIPKVIVQDQGLEPVLDKVTHDCPDLTIFALSPDSNRHLNSFPSGAVSRGAAVIVGPEGGFSAEEESILHTRRAEFANLGPRILRMELASVVALTFLSAECG